MKTTGSKSLLAIAGGLFLCLRKGFKTLLTPMNARGGRCEAKHTISFHSHLEVDATDSTACLGNSERYPATKGIWRILRCS
ncbi:hypothetical protein D3C76_415460 [compost metagenome]